MIMNSEDEKFFEDLSGAKTEADGEYDVELVKASNGAIASRASAPALQPKMIRTKDEREGELWNDGEPEGQLTVDVYQTPNDIVVESAIAGVAPDDIDVDVTTDSISIRGSRKREKTVRDEDYLYQECYWGKFGRSIILPQEVDPEAATVKFKNGILTVTLPKANKKKTRKLKVRLE
ncbi:MAG TPA: Hsp20/alpha crystallin family protein [Candidatus Paceibacterota bacterium]|nr:Hsp20/alpha crystallin family protein [Candidatus Paceibacterota bacterium]